MSYIILTVVFWGAFFILIPRWEWRRYYPQILFGALLGTISDLIGVTTFQWHYLGPTTGGLSLWADLGTAPAEAALFTWSWNKFPGRPWAVGLFWTVGNTLGEWLFVKAGWIVYGHWQPVKAFIFYVFFFLCLRLHMELLKRLEAMV